MKTEVLTGAAYRAELEAKLHAIEQQIASHHATLTLLGYEKARLQYKLRNSKPPAMGGV